MRGFPSSLLTHHNLRVVMLITTSSFQIQNPFHFSTATVTAASTTTTTTLFKSCRPNNNYYCSSSFSSLGNSVLGYSRSLSFSANVSSSGINEVGWKDPTNSRSSPPRGEVTYQEYQEPLVYGQQQQQQQEQQARFIPVNAFYLCTSVDLKGLQSRRAVNVIPPSSRAANYVVLKYPRENGLKSTLESGDEVSYVVVFQYGSVVLFNVADHEVDAYLEIVKEHGFGHLPEMRKDDYAVVEKPSLQTWMQDGLDFIVLKSLNIDGIRTIGSVLGQSVALDYYVRQVDGMVAEFTAISREMETTGTFTMKRKKLFQLVGKANTNLADVILKLGILERSDIAWKNANYAQIWEYLKDEFELTQRFGSLDFKLKFVEHNIRFLQEILQNRKSDFLEWIIIILICVEILIALYNMLH